jgi:D-alanyl-lipoteichoic acid acyltransferase DltB (MBOAT superfamily)
VSFEDRPFLILFVVTYGLWLGVRKRERVAVALLLSASLLFYAHNHWQLLPILLLCCVVDWAVGCRLERTRWPRLTLGLGVGFNLLLLCFWKYVPLVITTLASWTGVWLWPAERVGPGAWSIPFGISFYAFTGIAYLVDVQRGTCPAERNLFRYTLSAVFFPHLVAGPILRASEFLAYLGPGQVPARPQALLEAGGLLARGYFKKLVLVNRLAALADPFFAHVADPSTAGVWSLPYVYLYALQIYLDFSAYTDIARGLGLLFGYRWPDNFHLPYLAANVADFWRRWHITLSRFLRDYLYVPLGGNRCGNLRTCLNLMLTMLLGGLWHGAAWSFLLWGGLHGTYLIAHRFWSRCALAGRLSRLRGVSGLVWRGLATVLTFHCVCLAWCFFRLTVLSDSLACVRKWVVFSPERMFGPTLLDPSLGFLLAAYALVWLVSVALDRWQPWGGPESAIATFLSGCRWGLCGALLVLAVLLAPGGATPPFIYFQF